MNRIVKCISRVCMGRVWVHQSVWWCFQHPSSSERPPDWGGDWQVDGGHQECLSHRAEVQQRIVSLSFLASLGIFFFLFLLLSPSFSVPVAVYLFLSVCLSLLHSLGVSVCLSVSRSLYVSLCLWLSVCLSLCLSLTLSCFVYIYIN